MTIILLTLSAVLMSILIVYLVYWRYEVACNICPHIGLEICHNCTIEDRQRIIKLYMNDKIRRV